MELKCILESLLLVSPKPLELKETAAFLKKDSQEIEAALADLTADYQSNRRGMRIIASGRKYQMVSSPDNARIVQDFLRTEISGELTPASLETLTIVAYRGPIRKSELEKIRGINCSLILRNLLIKGLIEEVGRDEEDQSYQVSLEFVKFLGLSRVEDLPDYERFKNNESLDRYLGRMEEKSDLPALFNNEE